jgi:hypothetical protein
VRIILLEGISVLTRIVRENCGVARAEVECAGIRATNENSCAASAGMEVQPFFSLNCGLVSVFFHVYCE